MKKKLREIRQKKRGPGRPATGLDPVVTIRLPQELLAALDQARDGETRTDVIRAALERELERRATGTRP